MKALEVFQEDIGQVATDDLFEMANLRQNQTGIAGTIYVSTQQATHGARVKYYLDRPGKGAPSFSVSIEETPHVVENSLPASVVTKMSPDVIEWVRLNRAKLQAFWSQGTTWFDEEVTAFKASLIKLPSRRERRKTPPAAPVS